MRPGRFDRQVVVDRPDVKGREGILKVHTRKIPLGPDVDLAVIAKGTRDYQEQTLQTLLMKQHLLLQEKIKNAWIWRTLKRQRIK